MLEMARLADSGLYQPGIGGDSFNTAVYLARAGLSVNYVSRLGCDVFSDTAITQMQAEGINSTYVERVPGENIGLYAISNDEHGEREFSYWRSSSPVRQLFDQPYFLTDDIDAFYFTGITLAVTHSGRKNFLALLVNLRSRGVTIIFDPNYRALLWDDLEQAQSSYRAVLPLCDLILPTIDDDAALWGVTNIEHCKRFYQDFGIAEIVIKGPDLIAHAFAPEGHVTLAAKPVAALDTTGAGDSFNAGYLAERLTGGSLMSSLKCAQQLSAVVVQHNGAITPLSEIN